MSLLDDILGFVGEKFRDQNVQRQKAFEQFQKTGKLPTGFVSGAGGASAPMAGRISAEQWEKMEPAAKNMLMEVVNQLGARYPRIASKMNFMNTPFRMLGLARQASGGLKPDQYKELAQQVPGYDRYIDKVRRLAARASGGEPFVGYRGMSESDPLISKVISEAQLPEATAVSTRPEVAKNFANWALDHDIPRSHIARLQFGPEALEGLLPSSSRDAIHNEAELLINPQKAKALDLQAQLNRGEGSIPDLAPPNSLIQSLFDQVFKGGGGQ